MSNDNLDQISINVLQLSMQAMGSLKRSQIHTIADLMHYTQEDLKVLDPAASEEVMQALETRFGLTLPLNDLQ